MKKSIPLAWWCSLLVGGCALATAATAPAARPPDALDEIISAMSRGEPRGDASAAQAAIRAGIAETTGDAQIKMTEAYLAQVKASIVDPERHGGWPYRSWLIVQPTPRGYIVPILKSRFERRPDAIAAYAVICPALYTKDESLLKRALAFLEKNDPFLHKLALERMQVFWSPYISDLLKRQTPAPKPSQAEKDDPFSQLPKL